MSSAVLWLALLGLISLCDGAAFCGAIPRVLDDNIYNITVFVPFINVCLHPCCHAHA